MGIDPAILRRRLRAIDRRVGTLRRLRARGREAFLHDEDVQDRADRNAQLVAQACADVALHVCADRGLAPETYADALEALATLGVIPGPVATRLAAAARLRNLLVHEYLDVDHGRLFDELGWIDDAVALAEHVERWLTRTAP